MLLYVLINIVIAVIGIVAVLYLLFRLFAWRQGDARFVIEARRRKPFELKQMTADTAVFETVCRGNSTTNASSIRSWPIKKPNGTTTTGNLSFTILEREAACALPSPSSARAATSAKI